MTQILSNRNFQLVFLIYSSLLATLGRMNEIGLRNYDAAYYAIKSREIFSGSNPWVVSINNIPLFDNPPFFMWMSRLSFKLFGVSAYSAVLPTGLFAAATVYLTFRMAEFAFNNRWAAFLSGVVLIFPGYYLDYARRGMVDATLTFLVLLAMYSFLRALRDPKWFLLYGFASACAILTKSVAGFFPLITGFLFLIISRRHRLMLSGYFIGGLLIVIGLGSSWYVINWWKFGAEFIEVHFGGLIFDRTLQGAPESGEASVGGPIYFLGYLLGLIKIYWPWIPFAVLGAAIFFKKAVREKNEACLLVLLWVGVTLVIVSAGRIQYYRYMLPIFPALALLTSIAIAEWLSPSRQEKLLPYMAGAVMMTALFINSTSIEFSRAASLSKNSVTERNLAPVIRANTSPGEEVGNYKLARANPRHTIYFYAERIVADPVAEPEVLYKSLAEKPQSTWLARRKDFRQLELQFPGMFYLIQANKRYAYFTSKANENNVNYIFP